MNDRHRLHSALDVAWPASTGDVATLHELLAAAVDDPHTTAIQEFEDSWRVFFSTGAARDRAARDIARDFHRFGLKTSSIDVADDDWAQRSQADIGPVRVGRIVVAPPWTALDGHDPTCSTVIRILPSMGFGTGHHATTRLSLRAMQAIDLAHKSFLDVGTGSGVLAIAAFLLGATPVVAIDSDPDAVGAAQDNLRLNGADGTVRLEIRDFRHGAPIRAATVSANLSGGTLIRGRREITSCVDAGGILVVSGYTNDEAAGVLAALSHFATLVNTYEEEGWSAAALRILTEAEPR